MTIGRVEWKLYHDTQRNAGVLAPKPEAACVTSFPHGASAMNISSRKIPPVAVDEEDGSQAIDFSDLFGVNQAFLPSPDAARQAALIDAHCNKIGGESCC